MDRSTQKKLTVALIGAYAVLVVVVVWSPVPLTDAILPLLSRFDLVMQNVLGLPAGLAWRLLEFGANVAMFVPFGFLLALRLRPSNWAFVVIIGFVATVTVEMVQLQFLSGRSGTVSDIVANTAGTWIGAVIAFGVWSRPWRKDRSQDRRTRSVAGR